MVGRIYETVYILNERTDEKGSEEIKEKFESIVQNYEGEILDFQYMGEKELAYEIKKNKRGKYYRFLYNVDSEAQKQIVRFLRLDERILRFLTVKDKGFEKERENKEKEEIKEKEGETVSEELQ